VDEKESCLCSKWLDPTCVMIHMHDYIEQYPLLETDWPIEVIRVQRSTL